MLLICVSVCVCVKESKQKSCRHTWDVLDDLPIVLGTTSGRSHCFRLNASEKLEIDIW